MGSMKSKASTKAKNRLRYKERLHLKKGKKRLHPKKEKKRLNHPTGELSILESVALPPKQ
jgi:hypothetical protein